MNLADPTAVSGSSAGPGYTTALTGLKWMSKTPDLRFGYEEALGFCCAPLRVRRDARWFTAGLSAGGTVNNGFLEWVM